MAREPSRRYSSAMALQDALVEVKQEMAVVARAAQQKASSSAEWEQPTTKFRALPRPTRMAHRGEAPTPRRPVPPPPSWDH
jgi:hypothetical protein